MKLFFSVLRLPVVLSAARAWRFCGKGGTGKSLTTGRWLAAVTLFVSLAPVWGAPFSKPAPVTQPGEDLLREGDLFRQRGQWSGALWAYRQAAKAGNVDGAFAAGDLLLQQGRSARGRERILQLAEGLGDLFFAATNGDARACARLSFALQNGLGVPTNLVAAYAWLKLAADGNAAFRPDLDQLVVRLDPDQIRQAQNLAATYVRGHWPTDLVRPVDTADPRLQLQGLSSNGIKSLVIINNVTFTPGDTLPVQPVHRGNSPPGTLTVTCLKIGPDYVLLAIAGESHLKLLSTAPLQ